MTATTAMSTRRFVRPALAAALVAAVAVVGGQQVVSRTADQPAAAAAAADDAVPAAAPAAPRRAAPPAPRLPLRARVAPDLDATLLTVGRGFTLYRSDRDGAEPSVSRCVGACARRWRPVVVPSAPGAGRGEPPRLSAAVRLVGIDRRLLGTVRRPEGRPGGARQLTVAGWPVYRFGGDVRPGSTRGHCVGGFSAVTATGEAAMQVRVW